jgi:hypothetical protein
MMKVLPDDALNQTDMSISMAADLNVAGSGFKLAGKKPEE